MTFSIVDRLALGELAHHLTPVAEAKTHRELPGCNVISIRCALTPCGEPCIICCSDCNFFCDFTNLCICTD